MKYKGANLTSGIYLSYLRNWSKHPFSRKIRRFISKRFFRQGMLLVSPHGAQFRVSTFDYMDQEIIFKGNYEGESIQKSHELLKEGGVFVDIGANFGLYAIHLAKLPGVEAFAFEPNPSSFQRLKQHKELNQCNTLSLINLALGNEERLAGFSSPSQNNLGNVQLVEKQAEFYAGVFRFSTCREMLNIKQIDLMKIDVEGFELQVLQGIDFEQMPPRFILMEFIPDQLEQFGSRAEDCVDFLKNKSYRVSDIHGNEFTDPAQKLSDHNLLFEYVG